MVSCSIFSAFWSTYYDASAQPARYPYLMQRDGHCMLDKFFLITIIRWSSMLEICTSFLMQLNQRAYKMNVILLPHQHKMLCEIPFKETILLLSNRWLPHNKNCHLNCCLHHYFFILTLCSPKSLHYSFFAIVYSSTL